MGQNLNMQRQWEMFFQTEPKYAGGQLQGVDEEWAVSHEPRVLIREEKTQPESQNAVLRNLSLLYNNDKQLNH